MKDQILQKKTDYFQLTYCLLRIRVYCSGGEAVPASSAASSLPAKAPSVPKQRYALPKEPAKVRIPVLSYTLTP